MSRRGAWILGAVGLLLVLMLGASVSQPSDSVSIFPLWDCSTHRFGHGGYRALYRLLARLGYDVDRHERPLDELPPGVSQVWVVSPLRPMGEQELRSLRAWVADGGTLVWSRRGFSMMVELGDFGDAWEAFPELHPFHITGEAPAEYAEPADSDDPDEGDDWLQIPEVTVEYGTELYGADVSEVVVPGEARIASGVEEGAALLEDDAGVVIARVPVEAGQIVFLSSPEAFANWWISKGDNATLAVNMVDECSDGLILFDEYHHGFTELRGVSQVLAKSESRFGYYHLGAVCLLAVLAAARRFGAPREIRQPRRRSALEYVDSMAMVYESANARGAAVESIERGIRRRLCSRLGLGPGASDADIIDRAKQLRTIDLAALEGALRAAHAARWQCGTDAALLGVARQLDQIMDGEGRHGRS